MKKIYSILLSMFFAGGLYAQSGQGVPMNPSKARQPNFIPKKPSMDSRTATSFVVDYDYTDSIHQINSIGNTYDTRYRWDMNMHYLPTDTSQKYFTVVFDSIIDSYNEIPYDRTLLQSITLDTLYIVIGQENNSGIDDTLITKVLNVAANKIPGTTVLWADTTIIPAASPLGADWGDFVIIPIPVGYTYPSNTTRIAVKLEYWGNTLDTAGVICGFGYQGNCPSTLEIAFATAINPVPYNPNATAFPSGFSANTYVWFTPFNNGAQYPATNNYIYYPCDAVTGYQPGSDAWNLWQNALLYASLTVDDAVGIHNQTGNGMKLFQNNPNPVVNETVIRYDLKKGSDVKIEITDLTGRVLATLNEGYRAAGNNSAAFNASRLAAGTYFYTLKTENGNLTNTMVVSR